MKTCNLLEFCKAPLTRIWAIVPGLALMLILTAGAASAQTMLRDLEDALGEGSTPIQIPEIELPPYPVAGTAPVGIEYRFPAEILSWSRILPNQNAGIHKVEAGGPGDSCNSYFISRERFVGTFLKFRILSVEEFASADDALRAALMRPSFENYAKPAFFPASWNYYEAAFAQFTPSNYTISRMAGRYFNIRFSYGNYLLKVDLAIAQTPGIDGNQYLVPAINVLVNIFNYRNMVSNFRALLAERDFEARLVPCDGGSNVAAPPSVSGNAPGDVADSDDVPGDIQPWGETDSGGAIDTPPGSATDIPGSATGIPASSYGLTTTEVAVTATGAIAVGGIAGIGAWLMLGQTGVGRREALDGLGDLLRGRMPSDGFGDWKAKYEAMGWTYREENGVAMFDPPPGYVEQPLPQPEIPVHRDGEVNPDTDEVWSEEDGGWIGRNLYEQEKRRAGEIAAIQARSDEAVAEYDAQTRALDRAIAASARDRAARAAAEEAYRTRIGDKLTKLYEDQGLSTDEVERLRRENDTIGLEELYERGIRERMKETAADAQYWTTWSKIHGAGEFTSRVVLAGAKAGMMVATGPAGFIPAAVGSGILRSAEEGARGYVESGGDKRVLGRNLVSGFFAGAKDGIVGRFTALPKTGAATKVLLPAGADMAETAIRTGDLKQTLTSGVMSAAGGAAGAKFDTMGSAVGREAGNLATGATLGGAASVMNGGSFSEGAVNGLADAVGGRAGAHVAGANTPMTRAEIEMDLEYGQKMREAGERVDRLRSAIEDGNDAEVRTALHNVLDHREAKLIMRQGDVDPNLCDDYARLTQQHRTQPIFEGTADALNRQTFTASDGTEQSRYMVLDADGGYRPVQADDFASGSGSGTNRPGMDLDMHARSTIVDRETGRTIKRAVIDDAVTTSADTLDIDRHAQEINVTGMKSPEDFTMRPDETPGDFIARVDAEQAASGGEGQGITDVLQYKLKEADALHGSGAGSSAVAEKARSAWKDYDRLIKPMIEGDSKAQLPEVFRRTDTVTGDSPMEILHQIHDGDLAPGLGNARFRKLTGMNIEEGANKIASWAEPLGRWSSGVDSNTGVGADIETGLGSGNTLSLNASDELREWVERKDQ